MNATERIVKRLRAAADLEAELAKLEAEIRSKVKRETDRIARVKVPGKTKAAKKSEATLRLEKLAEIRAALHIETGGTCVICEMGLPFVRMHAHHILSGPERQTEERQDTMAPTHSKCHDWLHGKLGGTFDQRDALVKLLIWCGRTGREVAAQSTRRRIAKLDEARRVPAPF